jgi:hypothetical protein
MQLLDSTGSSNPCSCVRLYAVRPPPDSLGILRRMYQCNIYIVYHIYAPESTYHSMYAGKYVRYLQGWKLCDNTTVSFDSLGQPREIWQGSSWSIPTCLNPTSLIGVFLPSAHDDCCSAASFSSSSCSCWRLLSRSTLRSSIFPFRLLSASWGVTGRAGLGTMVVWDADIEWGWRELETNAFVPSAGSDVC